MEITPIVNYYTLVETEENIFKLGWEWLKKTDNLLARMEMYVAESDFTKADAEKNRARLDKYIVERQNA